MSELLELSDEHLRVAGSLLLRAAQAARERAGAIPRDPLPTVSGLGERVRWFLEAVVTARGSLADAAVTTGAAVAETMRTSSELDAQLAREAERGFAVRRLAGPKT